jgi:hypothetical protein
LVEVCTVTTAMASASDNEHTVSSIYIYTRAFLPKKNGVEVMALEVNKQLIDELIAVAFGQRKFDRVKTHNLCVGADAELEQLESKAKLADAFVWVLEHQPELIGLLYTYRGLYNLSKVPQSLIEAYEKGKEV